METSLQSSSASTTGYWMYTNQRLGFSMDIPNTIFVAAGAPNVPTKVFEDEKNDTVFVSTKYYFNAKDGIPDLKDRRETSFAILKSDWTGGFLPPWEIHVAHAVNDSDVERILRKEFGSGCIVDEMKTTSQEGVMEVVLNPPPDIVPEDPRFEECPLTYAIFIRYAPAKQKLIYWVLGQDVRFFSDPWGAEVYDTHMLESFRM